MIKCSKCGFIVTALNEKICPQCKNVLLAENLNKHLSYFVSNVNPWEQISNIGILKAILLTLKQIFFTPYDFFDKTARSPNAYIALIYTLVIGVLGNLSGFLWSIFFASSEINILLQNIFGIYDFKKYSAIALIFLPLFILLKQSFLTLYFHILIFLTHRPKNSIKFTFISVCYSESTSLLNLLPIIGNILSPIFFIYILTAAFSKMHNMSSFKALIIILLPLIICFFIFILIIISSLGASFFIKDFLKGIY